MGDSNSKSSGGCGCCGCLTALVLGTAIVGTIMIGGCSKAWHKVESTWAYDGKMQSIQKIFDADRNGTFDNNERKNMYKALNLPTIEGEVPSVKIPYESLIEFEKRTGQQL